MAPSEPLNLRLPPDVAALLDTAHNRVGPLVARHRLAVQALAIGLRAVVRDPAVLFATESPTAPQSVTPSPSAPPPTEAPREDPSKAPAKPAAPPRAKAPARDVKPGKRSTSKPTATSRTAAATAARWEPVAEADRVKLSRELDARLVALGSGAVDHVVQASGVHRSAVYNARKGIAGAEVYKALRAWLDTPTG